MEWASLEELGAAYGLAIGAGLLIGALIALFNSWRA
jgi:ABC-type nitrate/sulfonate/bicarbonate transport system permease component